MVSTAATTTDDYSSRVGCCCKEVDVMLVYARFTYKINIHKRHAVEKYGECWFSVLQQESLTYCILLDAEHQGGY